MSGDGGFLMNVQELETAKRLGLAIVNVIFRDGGYNLIQWKQQTAPRPRVGRGLHQPGLRGARPRLRGHRLPGGLGARTCGRCWPRRWPAPGPSIVDVPVDYRENPKLTERLGHLVCPI